MKTKKEIQLEAKISLIKQLIKECKGEIRNLSKEVEKYVKDADYLSAYEMKIKISSIEDIIFMHEAWHDSLRDSLIELRSDKK